MFGKSAPKKCLPRTTKRYQKITRTYRKSGASGLVPTFFLVTFGKSLRYLLQCIRVVQLGILVSPNVCFTHIAKGHACWLDTFILTSWCNARLMLPHCHNHTIALCCWPQKLDASILHN